MYYYATIIVTAADGASGVKQENGGGCDVCIAVMSLLVGLELDFGAKDIHFLDEIRHSTVDLLGSSSPLMRRLKVPLGYASGPESLMGVMGQAR